MRTVQCIKLKKEAEGLDHPPFPGELGVRIWRHVSKEAWGDWTRLQTMMVNEYGLNLADLSARQHGAVRTLFFRRRRRHDGSQLRAAQGRVRTGNLPLRNGAVKE